MVHHRRVLGLPESLAPLPRSPAPPCTPCVEVWQRAAPHSSSFPPTMAPFQTLHLDVSGPSPVRGPCEECYFLIVVDDYSCYTTVLPLRRKVDVPIALKPWLLARGDAQALCGLRLHSNRGGQFSSTRLETFGQGRGIIQSYTLLDSPQQNGVSERRISLVKEFARTSMCHVGAPQFLWPQAVRYAAHQLNLWPSDARPRVTPVSLRTFYLGVAGDKRCPVRVVFRGAGGAAAEGVSIGAVAAHGAGSGGAGGVRVETTPEEDTAVSTQLPRPASPFGFPSVVQFPPPSPPRPVAAEPGGVPAGGTRVPGVVVGGGSGSGGAGAGDTSTATPTPRTQQQQQRSHLEHQERVEEEFRPQQQVQLRPQQERVEKESRPQQQVQLRPQQERVEEWLRPQQHVQLQPQQERVEEESRRPQQVQWQPPQDVRERRSRVRIPVCALRASQCGGCQRFTGDPRLILGKGYRLVVLGGYGRTDPLLNKLFYPNEVLEDRQFELGFLAAAVPHLCAMLLALEGDPDALDFPIPCTHAEEVSRPWASYWIAAEEAKIASYRSTSTYIDTVPPSGANVINGMWLYKVKRPPVSPQVFKARYVARGFSQREEVDFFQTFAPTPKMTTLRIWLRRPPGFIDSFRPGTQRQLRRPVYGLRQAPREWHDTLRMTLAALDFFPSSSDPSLFVRHGSTPFFVLVYVDDPVFATPDQRALAFVKEELQRRHTCADLGELQRYLGLQITKDRVARTITLTQSHMVEQVLTRFRFPFSKVQLTPLAVDHGLTAPRSDEPFESSSPYSDVLAHFVAPGRHRPSHWYAAKRVAKYVASTSGMGLANNTEPLRSTLGYYFSLGTGAVSWRSTRASSVSSSSYEVEVYAAAIATHELHWLSFLSTDLGERPRSPLVLFANNMSAILLREEPRLVGKAKHILLRYFLLRELQQRGQALVQHVVSEANTTDIFTKALPPCDHQHFCTQLGLVSSGPHFLA
ncbi:unnamed protein product [Closterium sp. NIES-53]